MTTTYDLTNIINKFRDVEVSRLDRCVVITVDSEVDDIADVIFDNIKAAYGVDDDNEDEDEDCIFEREDDDLHYVIRTEIYNWVNYEMSKYQYKLLSNYKDPLLVISEYIEEFGELPDYRDCTNDEKLAKMRNLIAFKILYDIVLDNMRTVTKTFEVDISNVLEFIKIIDGE